MKFNWGTKIAAFYIAFVVFILIMVYMAFGEKYELVTEDYYQQEIEFQDKIDKSANAYALDEKLKITIKGKFLVMKFPNSNSTGTINFFRPSDESEDFQEKINSTDGIQKFDLSQFMKGKYIVKTEWKTGSEEYFQENIILIP